MKKRLIAPHLAHFIIASLLLPTNIIARTMIPPINGFWSWTQHIGIQLSTSNKSTSNKVNFQHVNDNQRVDINKINVRPTASHLSTLVMIL